jgi:hypothetical protein
MVEDQPQINADRRFLLLCSRPFAVTLKASFRHLRGEMFEQDLGFDR